ncbi:hypothetical protein NT6N_34690 [Oceaniferula spumae]|uniref:Uncharacterized protein n=1 Tax=Oceaniferula spumae TaxID=2979115 RepID=A0AAT9FRA1_9BACT
MSMTPNNPRDYTPRSATVPLAGPTPSRHASANRKTRSNFNAAENLTIENLKQMHPEWVDHNGDCPACQSLEHAMSDTTRYESSIVAIAEFQDSHTTTKPL